MNCSSILFVCVLSLICGLIPRLSLVHGLNFQIDSSIVLYGENNANSFGVNSQYYNGTLLLSATRYSNGDNRGALYGYKMNLTGNISSTPLFQQYGAIFNHRYGAGININPDNQVIFVGVSGFNSNKGIVYVYDLSNQTLLYNITEPTATKFGATISSYHSYLVVKDQSYKLFIYNFTRTGATFLYNLTYTGIDFAIDNDYLVIGADIDFSFTPNYGNVYVHHLNNGSLIKQLNGTQTTNFRLGFQVAFRYPYIVASAPFPSSGYVFIYDMTNNYQQTVLTGINFGERFGYSVALSPNNLLLVGAFQANSNTGRTDLFDFLTNTSSIYTWYGSGPAVQSGYTVSIYDDLIIIHEETSPNTTVQYGSARIYQYRTWNNPVTTTGIFNTTSSSSSGLVSTTMGTTSTSGILSISPADCLQWLFSV